MQPVLFNFPPDMAYYYVCEEKKGAVYHMAQNSLQTDNNTFMAPLKGGFYEKR